METKQLQDYSPIHNDAWHKLSLEDIALRFRNAFGDIVGEPSSALIEHLRLNRVGTIELIEKRKLSTTYRYKQTGVVYYCTTGENSMAFSNIEIYLQEVLIRIDSMDSILEKFDIKPLKFIYTPRNGQGRYTISHLQNPTFEVQLIGHNVDYSSALDSNKQFFDLTQFPSIDAKLNAFVKSYIK